LLLITINSCHKTTSLAYQIAQFSHLCIRKD